MKICGFDLRLIPALQLRLQNERTSILTTSDVSAARCSVIFLSDGKSHPSTRSCLFAKVGTRDAVLYPRLVPGSIVRVNRTWSPPVHEKGAVDPRIWLVEHGAGLTCCRVRRIDSEYVVLLPNCPPLSPWPLRLSRDARILGLVDLELRPQKSAPNRPMGCRTIRESVLPILSACRGAPGISRFLRSSRSRAGLTLRAAQQMTMQIASLLGNREYGISLGLLSDYEALNKLPRHVEKIISLSAVYGVDPFELMQVSGIHIDDSGKAPLFVHEQAKDYASSKELLSTASAELLSLGTQFDLRTPSLEQRSVAHVAGAES